MVGPRAGKDWPPNQCSLAEALSGKGQAAACPKATPRPGSAHPPRLSSRAAGSLEVPVLARRRQLLSVSSAASAASYDYNVSWTYVPNSSPNVTAGAASDFDVS